MKKTALILAIIIIFSLSASAQDYTGKARVSGLILDEQGKPVEGVRVKLVFVKTGTGLETATDVEGKWRASWIKGGTWNIDFDKAGFQPKKISIEVLEVQKNPTFETQMKKMEGLMMTDELKNLLTDGNILFDQEKYDEALAMYQSIIQKFPDANLIHMNVGNCYFQMEKYDQAEAAYMEVINKDARNVNAQIGIGNSYANRGDNAKALEWYRRIEFEKLEDPIVLYNVGTYLFNGGQAEEALKFYQKAVSVQKDFLDAVYQLGLAYLTLQKNVEALEQFENYLKLDAESQRAGQVKGFIEYLRKK